GITEVATGEFSISKNLTSSSDVTSSFNNTTKKVSVSSMTVDNGWVDIDVTVGGSVVCTKRFSLSKSKQGAPGISATNTTLLNWSGNVAWATSTTMANASTWTFDNVPADVTNVEIWVKATDPEGTTHVALNGTDLGIMDINDYHLPDNSTAWFKFFASNVLPGSNQNTISIWSTTSDGGTILEIKVYPTGLRGEQGQTGAAAIAYFATATPDVVVFDPNAGTFSASAINLKCFKVVGNAAPVAQSASFYYTDATGTAASVAGSNVNVTWGSAAGNINNTTTFTAKVGGIEVDAVTVSRIASGTNTYSAVLSNEAVIVATDKDGLNPNPSSAETIITVYKGTSPLTLTALSASGTGCTATANLSLSKVTISSFTADSGYAQITITADGKTFTKYFRFAKSRQGATGISGTNAKYPAVEITGDINSVYNGSTYSPVSVTLAPKIFEGVNTLSGVSFDWSYVNGSYTVVSGSDATTPLTINFSDIKRPQPETVTTVKLVIKHGTLSFVYNVNLTVKDTRYDWLRTWTNSTLIGTDKIATPDLFAGTNSAGSLTGVRINIEGVKGLKNNVATFNLDTAGNLTVGNDTNYMKFTSADGKVKIRATEFLLATGTNILDAASADAQTRASTAQSNAISTAAADATTKASAAQNNAISTAAADATTKANAAEDNANAYTSAEIALVNNTITLKTSASNLVSEINLAPAGVTISGDKINIVGLLNAINSDGSVTTISGNKITTGTITAAHMNVSSLSSMTVNAGTITAGLLKDAASITQFDVTNGLIRLGTMTAGKDVGGTGIHGINIDSNNYWYQNAKFRVGNSTDYLYFDGTSLKIYASEFKGTFKTTANVDVGATLTDHGTRITATENEVSLNVVKKGSIIASVNASSEGVAISANKINISGVVTAINGGTTTIDGSKITTGTVTAKQLQVGSNGNLVPDPLFENFSDYWSGSSCEVIDDTTFPGASGSRPVRVLKITTAAEASATLKYKVPVNPKSIYKFTLWFWSDNATIGTRYFGTYGYDRSGANTGVLNENGTVNTNPYFWNGDIPANTWVEKVGYLLPESLRGKGLFSGSPKFYMPSEMQYATMRFLNYYNGGTAVENRFAMPVIEEISTTIDGYTITTGKIQNAAGSSYFNLNDGTFVLGTDKLVWNGTTLSVKGSGEFSGTITATGGSITGNMNVTSTLTANNAKFGKNVTSGNHGLLLNANNYWYDSGTFRAGDANQYISFSSGTLSIKAASFLLSSGTSVLDAAAADATTKANAAQSDAISTASADATAKANAAQSSAEDYTDAQITTVNNSINLKVSKNDVINQINISTETIKLQGNKIELEGVNGIDITGVVRLINGNANGTTIDGGKITASSINSSQIAAEAITATHLAASSVTSDSIVAGAITTTKIAAGSVTATELAANSVTANAIAANEITSAKIAAGAIEATHISAGAVTANAISAATITGDKIAGTTITGSNLVAGTITGNEIAAGTITASNIAASTITGSQIVAGTIDTAHIKASAITSSLISSSAITADKISASAVTTSKIASSAITTDQLAAGAVTAAKILAGTIEGSNIKAGTISSGNIAAGAITATLLATDAVTAAKIQAGAVGADEIAANAVTAAKIAASAITATHIATGAIESGHIKAGAIETGHIEAGAITTALLAANAVTATNIQAGAVTVDKLAANAVTADKIAANAVTASEIATGAVTAAKISVSELSAIASDIGTVTAGIIRSSDSSTYFDLDSKTFALGTKLTYNPTSGLVIDGKLTTGDGSIAGWTIGSSSLSKDSLTINSSTPYIGLGAIVYGGAGIWLGKNTTSWKMSLYNDANNYFRWDGSKVELKTAFFGIDAAGGMNATSGNIAGWTIGENNLSSANLKFSSNPTSEYVALCAEDFGYNGVWFGTSDYFSFVPKMTSNTTPYCTISSNNSSVDAFKAFDGSLYSYVEITHNSAETWLKADLGSGNSETLRRYRIYCPSETPYTFGDPESDTMFSPKAWAVYGSADGTNWTLLDSRSVTYPWGGWSAYYTISSPSAFRYHRISFTSYSNATSIRVSSIEFQTTWGGKIHKPLTSNSAPAPFAVVSSPSTTTAYRIFDGSSSTYWNMSSPSGETWIRLFTSYLMKGIDRYRIVAHGTNATYSPRSWKLQGSNDIVTWVDLHTVSGRAGWTGPSEFFYTDCKAAFPYYRILISEYNSSSYVYIYELELYEVKNHKFSLIGRDKFKNQDNYLVWDDGLQLKGNVFVGAGENAITFEDSKIDLVDGTSSASNGWTTFRQKPKDTDIVSLGYMNEQTKISSLFIVESEFKSGAQTLGSAYLQTEAVSFDGTNQDYVTLRFGSEGVEKTITYTKGFFDFHGDGFTFDSYVKSPIPTWVGTATSATFKYPNSSSWTNAENCPFSNIWFWYKSSGTPNRVMYIRNSYNGASTVYWVALTEKVL
ncbi:MAG TPA: hypothetical protein P5539_08840, partial [Mesotoga sp.]|nr:hypothetical protein [Mesotoga sp.]